MFKNKIVEIGEVNVFILYIERFRNLEYKVVSDTKIRKIFLKEKNRTRENLLGEKSNSRPQVDHPPISWTI